MTKSIRIIACLTLLLWGFPLAVNASDTTCDLLTIEATANAQGIDPALSDWASIFRAAPFSQFDTFRLVEQRQYALALGAPTALVLPQGIRGTLEFQGMRAGQLNIALVLQRDERMPVILAGRATPGVPFMAGGLKSEQGRWVFVVLCRRTAMPVHYP
ncbi:MAG: hypothetical protein M0R76_02425 [Proteobacteria bacterium]|nr:hypothetical protein [Pseudomonadota bacterium]